MFYYGVCFLVVFTGFRITNFKSWACIR